MDAYLIDNIVGLRRWLAHGRELYELRANGQGGSHWQQMTGLALESAFDPSLPLPAASAKAFFFAERETLFRFDGQCFRETVPEVPAQVLFGVHACDLTAIAYQDQVFADDPYYRARREAALLVGLDCYDRCAHGFCHVVDAGPMVRETTADLVLYPRDGRSYLLLVTSERGRAALANIDLVGAEGPIVEERGRRAHELVEEWASEDDEALEIGIARLAGGLVEADFWQGVKALCIGCSGCTMLCPTCSCFSTRERAQGEGWERERYWDSCLYEGFQREASGHNPTASAAQRIERFWTHKFGPRTLADYGRPGCVGCGRCDMTCPGGIGARAILTGIRESAP